MKLHKPEQSPPIMRVNIKKHGYKSEHVAIADASLQEVFDWLKKLIRKQEFDIFATGHITNVQVRESIDGENGQSVSFSFKGLCPAEVRDLILRELDR